MITTVEIRKKADRLYPAYLRTIVAGEAFFPRVIRSDKSLSPGFIEMRDELAAVIAHSKDVAGFGYSITYETIRTRKHGEQSIPMEISFATEGDYLKFLKKEKEAGRFKVDVCTIVTTIPSLKEWLLANPLKVIENQDKWSGILAICTYFLATPKPQLYLRQLPVSVHTKFIEQNKAVIRSLLEFLIPESVTTDESLFEKRFNLKFSEPLIRVRMLDQAIADSMFSGLTDLSVRESEFRTLAISCHKVYIVENIMNFLAMPSLADAICIFGGGFRVNLLKESEWLNGKKIIYWGDIDVHGLQILSQLRGFFPHARSLMMDFATLKLYEEDIVTGEKITMETLEYLTSEESELFRYIRANNIRLEQEKIRHAYVMHMLRADR